MTLRLPTRGTGLPMLCVLASLLIALPASAFGLASGGDDPSDLVIAANGTTYIAGTTDSFGQGGGGDAVVIAVAPDGKGLDASTWGSIDLDRGASVALQSDATVVLGATASAPPYVLDRTSMKVGRLRATSAAFAGSVTQPTDILVDPGGVVFVPGGSTTFAGDFDTALVRLTP